VPCGSARKEASCRCVGQSMAGLGRAGTRDFWVPGPAAPSAGWPADRRWHHDRLAVDADRDLGSVGLHHDLVGGEHSQALPPRAAQKLIGLPGVVHCDGDDAERPGVEPRPAAERCTANAARTAIGVAITTAKASHLSTPRWARNQYAPAATRQRANRPDGDHGHAAQTRETDHDRRQPEHESRSGQPAPLRTTGGPPDRCRRWKLCPVSTHDCELGGHGWPQPQGLCFPASRAKGPGPSSAAPAACNRSIRCRSG
jgi:hypothetical protein